MWKIRKYYTTELYIEVAKQKLPALVEITPLKDKQARFL